MPNLRVTLTPGEKTLHIDIDITVKKGCVLAFYCSFIEDTRLVSDDFMTCVAGETYPVKSCVAILCSWLPQTSPFLSELPNHP